MSQLPMWPLKPLDETRVLLSAEEYRKSVEADAAPTDPHVCLDLETESIKAQSAPRRYRFVSTTKAVDRHRDRLITAGGDTKEFRKNPVVFFNHRSFSLPIAMEIALEESDSRHVAEIEFAPREINPLAGEVKDLLDWRLSLKALDDRGGAMSIGFIPKKVSYIRDRGGLDIEEWVKLEDSVVNIPANPQALRKALDDGVECSLIIEQALTVVRGSGAVVLDAARAEAVARALDPARGLKVFEIDLDALKSLGHPEAAPDAVPEAKSRDETAAPPEVPAAKAVVEPEPEPAAAIEPSLGRSIEEVVAGVAAEHQEPDDDAWARDQVKQFLWERLGTDLGHLPGDQP